MRLDTRAFAIAAGATAAVLFTICALAVAIAPGSTTAMFGYLVHMDLSALPRTLTLASFVGGLICWTVGTALTFALVATIYNRLIGVGPVASGAGHPPIAAQRA
jgi:hypothetical protein